MGAFQGKENIIDERNNNDDGSIKKPDDTQEPPLQVMSTKHILIFIGIMVVVLTLIALGLVFMNRFAQSKFEMIRKQARERHHKENEEYLKQLESEINTINSNTNGENRPVPPPNPIVRETPPPKKSTPQPPPAPKKTKKPKKPAEKRTKPAKPQEYILKKTVDNDNIDDVLKKMELDQWLEKDKIEEIKKTYNGNSLSEFILFVMQLEKQKAEAMKLDQDIIHRMQSDPVFVTALLQQGIVARESEHKVRILSHEN